MRELVGDDYDEAIERKLDFDEVKKEAVAA